MIQNSHKIITMPELMQKKVVSKIRVVKSVNSLLICIERSENEKSEDQKYIDRRRALMRELKQIKQQLKA